MQLFNIKNLFLLCCTLIGVVEILAMSFRQQHIIGSISRHLCRPTILNAFRSQNSFRSYSSTDSIGGADSGATSGSKKAKKKSKADSVVDNKNSTETLEDFRQTRLKKISTIRERGGNPFAYTFDQTHKIVTLIQKVPSYR